MDTNIKRTAIITAVLFVALVLFKEYRDVIPFLEYLPLLLVCGSVAWFMDMSIQMREDRKQEQMDRALRKLADSNE